MARTAKSVVDVVLGEAVSGTRAQRYRDMKAIASVIANRSRDLGVTPEQVVAKRSEFNAYGKALPSGVDAYRDLAEQAVRDVQQNGPVHNGSFYARADAVGNLPKGLERVDATAGHVYFSDPKARSINTAAGYRKPNPAAALAAASTRNVPTPTPAPRGIMLSSAAPNTFSPVQAVAPTRIASNEYDVPPVPTRRSANVGRGGIPTPTFANLSNDVMARMSGEGRVPVPTPAPRATGGILSAYGPTPAQTGATRAIGGLLGGERPPGLAGIVSPRGKTTLADYDRKGLSPGIGNVMDALAAAGFAGAGINSGYRDPAANARAGGAKRSQHQHGNALDVDVRGWSDDQKSAFLESAVGAGAKGIGIYSSGNVVHIDTRASPALWGANGSYAGMPVSKAPAWAQPTLNNLFSGTPIAPRKGPMPQMASLPANVQARIEAPAMPPLTRNAVAAAPAAPAATPKQGGLLSSFANGIADTVGGLFGAVTGMRPAAAAVPPQAAAPMGPLSAPTPKGRRVGATGPLGPDQRIAAAYDVAMNTRFDPGPLPAAAPRTVGTARQAQINPTPAMPAPRSVPVPTAAPRAAPAPALSAPRTVGPGPAVASAAPVVSDPWGRSRTPTAAPVSPVVDNAATFTPAPTRSATMKDVARGALLGGMVGGPVGLVGGGLLGAAFGPQIGGMFGGGNRYAAGDGINTGLITGGAIPASVRANPQRYAPGGFTGLGLPSTPRAPSQSQAAKDRDRRGGRGDSGPAMSKGASDAIGKAGAGRGGLW